MLIYNVLYYKVKEIENNLKFYKFVNFMDVFSLFGIAIALSFDSFAASVSCGLNFRNYNWVHILLIPFSFAFFQAIFPLIGYLVGKELMPVIKSWDHWLAFGLLFLIGGHMIIDAIRNKGKVKVGKICFTTIIVLSFATSIDALAAGFSFGLLEVNIWFSILIIFLVTFLASELGLLLGKRLKSPRINYWANITGGLILIIIGAKVAITHMLDHGILS